MIDRVDYSHETDELEDSPEDFGSIQPLTLPFDKKYHIFISYKGVEPDSTIAHRIDKLLCGQGYKVCLHERDFQPGEYISDNIYRSIERSIKVVFLLSENSKASQWCKFELNVTETIHIQEKGYKPIIIKLDECTIPDFMKGYTYLSGSTPPEQWITRLAKAVNNQADHLITSRRNIKFVALPCIQYNTDKNHTVAKCRYPHICAKYIISDDPCDRRCGKNHNLVTQQSREILVDLGFFTDGHEESLLKTYSQKCKEKLADWAHTTVLGPCCYYNYRGCLLGDFRCPFTHICNNWFLGKCDEKNCKFSHDILNEHTKRLLEIFYINTNKPADVILDVYREKYQRKILLRSTSKVNVLKEHWSFIVGGGILIVLLTTLVVQKLKK